MNRPSVDLAHETGTSSGSTTEEAKPAATPVAIDNDASQGEVARPQPKIEVVPVDDRHDEAVATFFRQVWSENATAG